MVILRDLLGPLQTQFSDSKLGRDRAHWFVFTLLAVIVPLTSSMTSNLLRSLQILFGLNLGPRRFYTFMASSTIPWQRLWREIWRLIPEPSVDGRNEALRASMAHDWETLRILPPCCVKKRKLSRFFFRVSNATCSPMINA